MKRSQFHRLALAAVAPFLLLLVGCGQSQKSDADRPEIALVMKSLANEFFQTMADGAEAHHAANAERYDLIVNGIKNETDLGQQLNLIEQMVARQVAAIVIAPADSKALVPALKRVSDAGILVVNIDNRLDEKAKQQAGLQAPFVGPDNRDGARRVGETLAAELGPNPKVAIIEGVPTAFNGQQRRLGFEDAMKAAGAEVLSVQAGNWEMSRANTIASALLTRYPDLDAILCANDSMALGAVAAVEAAGRSNVKIVGFDNISAIAPLIESGKVVATADQQGDQLAVYGIEAALAILSGEAAPEDRTTTVDIVTQK